MSAYLPSNCEAHFVGIYILKGGYSNLRLLYSLNLFPAIWPGVSV